MFCAEKWSCEPRCLFMSASMRRATLSPAPASCFVRESWPLLPGLGWALQGCSPSLLYIETAMLRGEKPGCKLSKSNTNQTPSPWHLSSATPEKRGLVPEERHLCCQGLPRGVLTQDVSFWDSSVVTHSYLSCSWGVLTGQLLPDQTHS